MVDLEIMKSQRLSLRQVDTNIVIVGVDPTLATPGQVVAALAKVGWMGGLSRDEIALRELHFYTNWPYLSKSMSKAFFLYYIFTGWTKHNICLGFNV